MTRAALRDLEGVPIKTSDEDVIAYLRAKQSDTGGDVYEQAFKETHESDAFKYAARLTRLFKKDMDSLYSELQRYTSDTEVPLTQLVHTKNSEGKVTGVKVRVFTNIKVKRNLMNSDFPIIWWGNTEVLDPTMHHIELDKEKAGAPYRWGSSSKTWKTMKKNKVVSIGRFLSDTFDVSDTSITDELKGKLMPVEVFEATTLKECIEVYENGPQSCMMTASEHARSWAGFYQATKDDDVPFHAISMYHYSPDAKVIGLRQGDKFVARIVVWNNDAGVPSYRGKTYSASRSATRELEKWCRQEGIEEARTDYVPSSSFSIPEYITPNGGPVEEGTSICPIAYVDRIRNVYKVKHQDDGSYLFTPTPEDEQATNVSLTSTNGYVTAATTELLRCEVCGQQLNGPEGHSSLDGRFFCGTSCAGDRGYVNAMREPEVFIYIPKEHACKDAFNRRNWFENNRVAASMGRPVLYLDHGLPERIGADGYSIAGETAHTSDGQRYAITGDDAAKIFDVIGTSYEHDPEIPNSLFDTGRPIHINIHHGEMRLERE
jgi:hypothetical protein